MATYSSNYRTAADLTAQARAAADIAIASYRLAQFLPAVDNFTLDYNFDINSLGLTDVAEYRAFDSTPGYGQGGGQSKNRAGTLPPVSRRYRVKEKEQLDLYTSGQTLIGAKYDEYAQKAGLAIAARVGKAQAQGIEFGQVTLNENGLSLTVDYGRSPSHNVVAANLFSNATADPTDALISWVAAYTLSNGVPPATTLISQRILDALSKNKYVISHATGRNVTSPDLPNRVAYPDVISYLAAFGITGVEIFTGAIDKTVLLSDNKIYFLPSSGTVPLLGGSLGTTEWGITAEAINQTYGISPTDAPGIFAAAFDDNQPQGTDVLGTAVVIPAIRNADATFVAQVL